MEYCSQVSEINVIDLFTSTELDVVLYLVLYNSYLLKIFSLFLELDVYMVLRVRLELI